MTDDGHTDTIVFRRSVLAEIPTMFWTVCTFILAVVLTVYFPQTIQFIPLSTIFGVEIKLPVPLFLIVPLIFVSILFHTLFNSRYTIGRNHVTETSGLLSFNKVDRRVEFQFIRGVEVERTLLGRLVNVGDLKIGSAAHAEIEVTLGGIKDPSHWRDIILKRMAASGTNVSQMQNDD